MSALPDNRSPGTDRPGHLARRFDLPQCGHLQHLDYPAIATNETAASPVPAPVLVRRIVDTHQAGFGRELVFATTLSGEFTDDRLASEASQRISSQLRALSLSAASPAQKSFVRTSRALLFSPAIEWLPASAQIFALDFVGEPDAALLARCRKLRDRGFSLALTSYAGIDGRSRPLLTMLDIIEIKLSDCDEATCAERVGALRGLPIKLMASGVNTAEQLLACRRAGFHLFQGDHIAPHEELEQDWLPVSRAGLVRLLALVMRRPGGEDDWKSIEDACQREPSLLINLLHLARRTARAPAPTAAVPSDVRHLLEGLDEYTLKCWIELQLAALDGDPTDYARSYRATQLAALGGRLLEQLMHRLEPGNSTLPAEAYLIGCLSIIPRAAGQTMSDFLRSLPIPTTVVQALLQRDGILGQCLDILDHFDKRDALACDHLLRRISHDRLGYSDLQACFAEALAWLTTTDE